MLSYIDNHVDLALARVAQQYRGKARIEGVLTAIVDPLQEADNALWQLATERYLFSDAEIGSTTVNYQAVGVQLDVIGRIIGLTRSGMTDDDYRAALKAQVRVIKSSGATEEIIAVFYCVEPDSTITITNWTIASLTCELDLPITASEAVLYRRFLRQARAAGVKGILLWRQSPHINCFKFCSAGEVDGSGNGPTGTDQGFGEGNLTSAGE